MGLYLDTEFNGFSGKLISMGIVSSATGKEFYQALHLPSNVHPWVAEHVVPFILVDPVSDFVFDYKLVNYLREHESETIYADWPADFTYLLERLYKSDGVCYNLNLKMELISTNPPTPKIPHNALSDARALMLAHLKECDSCE